VTKQLLAFSGQQTLTPQRVEPSEPLRECVSFISQSLSEKISITADIPSNLWPLRVDLTELQLALVNLALNARDAMPTGGSLSIVAANRSVKEPRLGIDGDYLVIEISDTGIGIPPDILARVFDPFFTTGDPASSRGLGLSQVHGFAHQSDGAVDIASKPGQGTTVTLYLRSAPAFPVAAGTEGRFSWADRKAGTVLVVEDDPDVAEITAALLEEGGFDVKLTHGARAALDILKEGGRVDVVLSDIIMPGGISGMQLAEEVRRLSPEIPVLLTTGYSEAAADAAARGLRIIAKPYKTEELCASVGALLTRRSTKAK
jgi:CheY-like chemotaxis protein